MGSDIKLNWVLRLEEKQRVPDGAGGFTETWVGLGKLWAQVASRGVSATEVTAGSTSLARYRIFVRGASVGDPQRPQVGQRFRGVNRYYAIDSVSESDPSGAYLICMAREEVLA